MPLSKIQLVLVCAAWLRRAQPLRAPCGPLGTTRRVGAKASPMFLTMKEEAPGKTPNLATKAAWFATEAFGRLAAKPRDASSPPRGDAPPRSVRELASRLEADYRAEPPYFISGAFDRECYAEDCEFADPFVAFRGRDRFEANLANLAGGFIEEASARPLGAARVVDGERYEAKFLVKLRLALPWRPVLAWPWGVTHVFGDGPAPGSKVVVRHVEAWDVSPEEGLRQLFRPGAGAVVSSSSATTERKTTKIVGDDAPEKKSSAPPNALGSADPIVGPVVAAARAVGALPKTDAGGWTGEPLAWADADSLAQRFSGFSQQFLAGFKQWTADLVAGSDYDAAAIDAKIDALVADGGCVVFAFTTCPFCKRALDLLDGYGAEYTLVNLDLEDDGPAIRARLGRKTGRTSVPSVFIGGEGIGGMNDGTPGLGPLDADGLLVPKLKGAGALR